MANIIHSTALITDEVKLGDGNVIGAYCVITGDVEIGNDNNIRSAVTISGSTKIGDKNDIGEFSSIGSFPEHKKYWDKIHEGVEIGNNNVLKEYVSISAGCTKNTKVGNGVWMLRGCYVVWRGLAPTPPRSNRPQGSAG